ncbi:RusA family crossover junction endodeoxyribonuclease [Vagococcus vulneris]|uniref:RusA family crossover junction endodeoxyribonuclease n=1 Tax=Vagococcus vulneris TaxID=1977869 RepID=UPI00197E9831|nr:RusA family crossover junction endodeoxyribonuclease [Vagococcus vulneris]
MIRFFMPMKPPTTTHQQKKVTVKNGKPIFYEPTDLKAARSKLMAHLGQHVPEHKIEKGIHLTVKWLFPITGKHSDGEYKITKPDTDNLNKLLKDCMTDLGFWKDDQLVASELIQKFYAEIPGIFIQIERL